MNIKCLNNSPKSLVIIAILMLLVIIDYLTDPFLLGQNKLGVSLTILLALGIAAYAICMKSKAEYLKESAKEATLRFENLSQNMNIAMFEQNLTTQLSWGNELFTSLFPELSNPKTDKFKGLLQLIEPKRSNEILGEIEGLSIEDPTISKNFTISLNNQETPLFFEGRFRKRDKQGNTYLCVGLINRSEEIKTQLALQSAEASLIENKYKLADLDYLLGVTALRSATDILSLDLSTKTVRFVFGGKSIGIAHEECTLSTISNAIMPNFRNHFQALTQGDNHTIEVAIIGDAKITYWWRITPLTAKSTKDTLTLLIRDITEEKLTNDRMRQARLEAEIAIRRLNVTADIAGIGLLEIDSASNKIRPSPTLREMLDLPLVDLLPIDFLVNQFDGVSTKRLTEVLDRLSLFTGPERFDLSMGSDDDEKRHFVLHLSSQGLLSSDRKVLGSLTETTEYIQLQNQLREALNRSNQALEELEVRYRKEKALFGFISHEIRTPVSAVRMMLEDDDDHSEELLNTTESLESLIDELKVIIDTNDLDDGEETKFQQPITTIQSSTKLDSFDLTEKKVLLAEDTPTIRMLSTKLIESQGASVAAAEDGEKALEIALNKDFDLVITDIFMPNMDGYELTRSLRENGYTGPIIGVTAATIGEERDKLIAAGANAAIGKPLTKEKLLDTLAALYDHTEQIDS